MIVLEKVSGKEFANIVDIYGIKDLSEVQKDIILSTEIQTYSTFYEVFIENNKFVHFCYRSCSPYGYGLPHFGCTYCRTNNPKKSLYKNLITKWLRKNKLER